MNLYLMRHGLAVDRGTPGCDSDRERSLTSRGERKIRRIAEALPGLDFAPEVILSSPLVRARQTAEVVAREMKSKPKTELTEHLAPGGSVKEVIALVQGLPGSPQEILLVGHEPDLGRLASVLLTGGEELMVLFKKGGLAKLVAERLKAGRCAALEWLLTPGHFELMG